MHSGMGSFLYHSIIEFWALRSLLLSLDQVRKISCVCSKYIFQSLEVGMIDTGTIEAGSIVS